MTLLERVVVPVANEADAVATAAALGPYTDDIRHLTLLHVVEKGGGTADKAPMEKRRTDAAAFLASAESLLGDEVAVETRIEFGTSVPETIVETALDAGASAIAFAPRGGNRLVRFLSGDTAARLVTESDVPVVSLSPRVGEESSSDGRSGSGRAGVGR